MSTEALDRVKRGDRRALARMITALESSDPGAESTLSRLVDEVAPCRRIGVTGPPGAGKSTLVNAMIAELRARGLTVAVLAFDPSSPITGGALLGDRIRMQGHVGDPGVYVRSLAARGHLGGLAKTAGPVIAAVSRAGFDVLLVETVGVGQSEVEVMDMVDLVVLVLSPGWGDQVQADKAGVVEIADVVVVNKADRPGAEDLRSALSDSLGVGRAPVLLTAAITGQGVAELVDSVL